MFPSHNDELKTVTFQFLATLDHYDAELGRLSRGFDSQSFTDLSLTFDEMRMYVGNLPMLSVPWMEALITRYELCDTLWRSRASPESIRVAQLLALHRRTLEALRGRCERALKRPES